MKMESNQDHTIIGENVTVSGDRVASSANANAKKKHNLLKLTLSKCEDDMFVKPSPVSEAMSPARLLQYELQPSSATPTMKRAAIDFDLFDKNCFDEYFEEQERGAPPEEHQTVRHEISYGMKLTFVVFVNGK